MKIAFITLLFYSALASAQYNLVSGKYFNSEVQLAKDSSKVMLEGNSCKQLEKEAAAIAAWTNRIGEIPEKFKCNCHKHRCAIDVTNIVPSLVKQTQGSCASFDGPNCWNGALVVSKLTSNLRYTSSKEMAFWMKSPLCKERATGEAPVPGDIIAIREKTGEEVHGFIHLTENLSFSKNGYSKTRPYSLQSPEHVYREYKVPKSCQGVFQKPAGCKVWSNVYACISVSEYFEKHPIKDEEAKAVWMELEASDCEVSNQSFTPVLNEELLLLANTSLASIKELAKNKIAATKNDEDKFIWNAILEKAKANLDQTDLFKD